MENDGFEVDGITLVNVLSACSHSGLVEVGKQIFGTLVSGKRYRFPVGIKHYACMVDILARGGCLYEALKCIEQMPFEPTKSMWGSLMNGCKERGDLELAKFIAEKLVEMEPRNGAYYVVLCNVYGEMGRWDDAARARELMRVKGLKKDSGCSSVGLEDRTEHGYGLLINGVSS
ncbi:Pentatricopeptide repeat-containing protein At5g40410, mitochondrial [Linum perenne]